MCDNFHAIKRPQKNNTTFQTLLGTYFMKFQYKVNKSNVLSLGRTLSGHGGIQGPKRRENQLLRQTGQVAQQRVSAAPQSQLQHKQSDILLYLLQNIVLHFADIFSLHDVEHLDISTNRILQRSGECLF